MTWVILKVQISGYFNEEGDCITYECDIAEHQNKIVIIYTDMDGNVVTELKAGQEYKIKVEPKDVGNYEIIGETEKVFTTEVDIELPSQDNDNIFIVKDSNTTFEFINGNGEIINYDEHTYDPLNPIYLKKIAANDSLLDIANQFINVNIRFFSRNDEELTGTENIATGMKLRLYIDDQIIDEIILVVKGDINGDGKINMLDKAALNAYTNGSSELDGAFKLASDINDDGKINMMDKASLNAFTNGSIDFFEGLSVKENQAQKNYDENHSYLTANSNNNNKSNLNNYWYIALIGLIFVIVISGVCVLVKKGKNSKSLQNK